MPVAKKDYTLRKLRAEHIKASKRLEGWEDAVQLALEEVESGTKKEISSFLLDSVTHYRKEVSSLRDTVLKEEAKLESATQTRKD